MSFVAIDALDFQYLCATRSSRSRESTIRHLNPPGIKIQSTARTQPRSLTRRSVRNRASTSHCSTSPLRAPAPEASAGHCGIVLRYAIVTGSNSAIAVAIATNNFCAGLAPRRQLSVRSGHNIQQPACGSKSAGMRKPSFRGVDSIVFDIVEVVLFSVCSDALRVFILYLS